MTELRRLNAAGIAAFSVFLEQIAATPNTSIPTSLLTGANTSDGLNCSVEVEQRTLGSRLAAAQYLGEVFDATGGGLDSDPGIWAWLSLFYFDELCPVGKGGRRKPGETARWLSEGHAFRYYRHLLAGPYRIHRIFQQQPERAAILLAGPLDKPGDYNEQLASRQELITNRGVIEAVNRLYFDPVRGKYRRGGQARELDVATQKQVPKAGTLRRFVEVIDQLDLTFDLYAFHELGAEPLLELLPREFTKWKTPQSLPLDD